MMDAARRIVAVKLDRLARNTRDFLTIADELRKRGCDLVLIAESFDTSTATGQFFLTMLAAMAELEAANIGARVMSGKREKAQKGGYLGAPELYGYTYTGDDTFVVVDDQAATVRRIFDDYVNGASLTDIAGGLNDAVVPTKRGGRWHPATVRYILNNGAYAGLGQWGDVEAERSDTHPAIIARDVYDAATRRMATMKRGPRPKSA